MQKHPQLQPLKSYHHDKLLSEKKHPTASTCAPCCNQCYAAIQELTHQVRELTQLLQPRRSTPKPRKPKPPIQFDSNYITFRLCGITVGHLDLLRRHLIRVGWIARDTQPDDFINLFTGKTNTTRIIWTGTVGKGMLLFLFSKMVEQKHIAVPTNHSITTILENHFINANGNYLSGLNSSKPTTRHLPVIKECLDILLVEVNTD